MNIIRRRYDVILKLTIMLALIGCFFIAGGKDVKATTISNVSVDQSTGVISFSLDNSATVEFYLHSGTDDNYSIGSISGTNGSNTYDAGGNALRIAHVHDLANNIEIYYSIDGSTPVTTNCHLGVFLVKPIVITNVPTYTTTHVSGVTYVPDGTYMCYCLNNSTINIKARPNADYYVTGEWKSTDGSNTITDITAKGNSAKVTIDHTTGAYRVTCKPAEAKAVFQSFKLSSSNTGSPIISTSPIEIKKGNTEDYYVVSIDATGTSSVVSIKEWIYTLNTGNFEIPTHSTTAAKIQVMAVGNTAGNPEQVVKIISNNGTGYDNNDEPIELSETFKFVAVSGLTGVTITGTPSEGYKGQPIILTANPNSGASVGSYQWQMSTNGITYTDITGGNQKTLSYTPDAIGSYWFKVIATDALNPAVSRDATTPTITVIDNKLTKLEFGADTYEVTVGYKVSATVQATPTAALVSDDVNFSLSNTTYATIASSSENETTGVATAVIKGVKENKDTDVTLTAKGKTNTTVTDTAKIKVYASPTDSSAFKYTESTRVLKGALPDKVLVGNTSYDIDKVTGFKIYVMKGSEQLGTITYKDKGTTGESSASDLESIIKDNVSKFSGDTDTIKLRAVALGTYGSSSDIREAKDESGNLLAWETEVKVYKVSVSGTGITGSQTYGLQGQKVSLTATPAAGYTSVKWSNGSTSTVRDDITVSSTTSSNQLKAEGVLGANTATDSASGDGYDDVPKTSESNMPFIFIIFSVFAVIGTGYALYMTLRPARTGGTDDTDDYDNYDE